MLFGSLTEPLRTEPARSKAIKAALAILVSRVELIRTLTFTLSPRLSPSSSPLQLHIHIYTYGHTCKHTYVHCIHAYIHARHTVQLDMLQHLYGRKCSAFSNTWLHPVMNGRKKQLRETVRPEVGAVVGTITVIYSSRFKPLSNLGVA